MEAIRERDPRAYALAVEIHHVASTVQAVVHGLPSRELGASTWLRLQVGIKGKKGTKAPNHTVRDYVIYRYAKKKFPEQRDAEIDSRDVARADTKKLMGLCPLGFDFTSNAKTLQVDHFYPSDAFIATINDIAEDTSLRNGIQDALIVINNEHAQPFDPEFIEQIVPLSGPMDALKCIYYNYSANLWPLSGSINAKKGARDAFEFAMDCVKKEFRSMGATLDPAVIAETEAFIMEFESTPRQGRCIIPHLVSNGTLRTGLECFLFTSVGKAARKICSDVAKIGQMGMESAYALAIQLQQPETHSAAKGMQKAIEIVHHTRKDLLPHPSDAASSSDNDSSSLDSTGLQVLTITRDNLTTAVDNTQLKIHQRRIRQNVREFKNEHSRELPHRKSPAAPNTKKPDGTPRPNH